VNKNSYIKIKFAIKSCHPFLIRVQHETNPAAFIVLDKLTRTEKQTILTVPGDKQYCFIDTQTKTAILPSGRLVTPAGETIRITHDPFGMSISPDGKSAVALHNGVFTIINLLNLNTTRVPSYDGKIVSPLSNGSFLGVAFSTDSRWVYLSGGDNGAVIIYDITTLKRVDSISLNGPVNGEPSMTVLPPTCC
jgi:WD40 repeat protein